ncbi:MAG: hypothetical protein WCO91_04365 [Gemmataceae bacterium]
MNRRRFLATLPPLATAGLMISPFNGRQAPQVPPISPASLVRDLKYAELGRLVRAQTGKVVLVDLWRHD